MNQAYLLDIEGYLSINVDEDSDVNITIKTGPDTYILDYVHLGQLTTYVVQQTENTTTDPYHYEITIFGVWPIDFKTRERKINI